MFRNRDVQLDTFHKGFAEWNGRRLTPTCGAVSLEDTLGEELAWRKREDGFVRSEQAQMAARASEAPTDADGFIAWFESLNANGPGQGDPLFPYLAEEASRDAMIWFLTQEVAGEAGFDDLVALTQVKLPTKAKLEMARNYWDEMGQGHAAGMHGPMLDALVRELEIPHGAPVVWESRALGNLMTAFATNRRFTYQSVGALGVIELTAPGRAACVNQGLKRLGISGQARRYFALHATLDIKHSEAWDREVLQCLVTENPACAHAIAEGALMRLEAGRRCFERYRLELTARGEMLVDEPPPSRLVA